MALDQQTIQGLNQYAGNAAVQVGGNIPLVPTVSENALNKLLEVTDNYAKEKRAEKDEWEKSVAERIATISKTDGVLPKDIAEISKDKKDLINYIRENSYLLAPSNQVKQPEKYAELEGKVQDYLSKVEKSKADNVIWKEYSKISSKPEYANRVMKKRADEFLSKPILEREAFSVSATPKPLKESDLESIFMSTATSVNPVSTLFGANNSLVSVQNEYTIDRNDFVNKSKSLYPEHAQFFREEYESLPEEEKTMLAERGVDNADDYADTQLGNLVPETGIVRGVVKTMVNPDYTETKKDTRLKTTEEGKDRRAQWTNATRVQVAEKNNAFRYWKEQNGGSKSEYPALASIITQVNGLESKGTPSQFFKDYAEIGTNEVPANIVSAIYTGGEGKHKGAFGSLFRSTKNGITTYTLGVEKWYEKKNGKADYTKPDNMNIHSRIPDEYVSRIEPSTDPSDTYTEAQLLEKAASLNDASRKEYNEALTKNPDLFSFYGAGGQQTQSNQTTQPKAGKLRGINEMFWNPMGRKYDQGSMIQGTTEGHDNHIHFGFEAPDVAVAVIKKAQELGLSVRENPYVDKVDPVHTEGSFHYGNFAEKYNGKTLGKGLDVSGDKTKMRQLFEWAETTYGDGVPSSTPAKPKSTATKSTGKKKGNAKDYGL